MWRQIARVRTGCSYIFAVDPLGESLGKCCIGSLGVESLGLLLVDDQVLGKSAGCGVVRFDES